MAKKDVDMIIYQFRNYSGPLVKIENCSRSKAYSIKREIDKRLNSEDRFCEVKYDEDSKVAYFDIVS